MLTLTSNSQTKLDSVSPEIVTLSDIRTGESAHVVSLSGGHRLMGRMAALGFTPGVEVTVIQNSGWGPIITSVRGTRVALGRREAAKTVVEKS